MTTYAEFLAAREQLADSGGFEPVDLPGHLFDYQRHLVEWAVRQGRGGIFADCGLGKAQPVTEPVLTPCGWVPIGSLSVGDEVYAVDGSTTRVVGVFPQGTRDIVRVTMNDGASTRCDTEHLWTVATDLDISRGRPWRTMTTSQIIQHGLRLPPRNGDRWRVPVVSAIQHRAMSYPIDPYVMGVFLGDGSFREAMGPVLTCADEQIAKEVANRLPSTMRLTHDREAAAAQTYRPVMVMPGGSNLFLAELRNWNLQGKYAHEKHIPPQYLAGSIEQRLDLLRGLMDTDGYVSKGGTIQFGSSSMELALGVRELVQSLGGIARWNEKIPTYTHRGERRNGRRHFTLTLAMPHGLVPFNLARKVDLCSDRYYVPQRKIRDIEPVGREECVCIRVEHSSQLYVTSDYIVTHNTPMSLAWADQVHRHTGKPVLLLTPLAVGQQIVAEAEKFGHDAAISRIGKPTAGITVTNYEQLEKFDPHPFGGVVCDESSILKSFDGATKAAVTEFMRRIQFRLLATATAAPNDYTELGTSSEALGGLGHMDMLTRFFINDNRSVSSRGRDMGGKALEWRLKGHAAKPFWRWVATWARAIRKPSDFGFSDDRHHLPELIVRETLVEARTAADGTLFDIPAYGLREEREETRRTLVERCEAAAEKLADAETGVAWCHLNDESALLTQLIDGAEELTGSDTPDTKEAKLIAFSRGEIRVLVTKPKLAAWGLNWQHSHRMTYFPSHSYEQWYQAVRRMWRFGQTQPVEVDVITTEGGSRVLANLQRKADQADRMFTELVEHMNQARSVDAHQYSTPLEVPAWLAS